MIRNVLEDLQSYLRIAGRERKQGAIARRKINLREITAITWLIISLSFSKEQMIAEMWNILSHKRSRLYLERTFV
jgi:hypothetical protein